MSEAKTAYQAAVDWYKEDEIHRSILSLQKGVDRSEKIPTDILSKEFAVWLTGQYRAAMSKGIHFGEQRKEAQLTAAQARIAELEELIVHCWIHCDMRYAVNQMTTEQKADYHGIVSKRCESLATNPGPAAERGSDA